MRIPVIAIALCFLVPLCADAQQTRTYSWEDPDDGDGVKSYGDSIPAKYAELEKRVLNEHGVVVETLEGKKTPEQIEAERVANAIKLAALLRQRADQALLATYIDVDEIELHRDRRVELFQAQARVTQLYLRNLRRRLTDLEREATRFKPYSLNPSAAMVDPGLVRDIESTKETIGRHEINLSKYETDEQNIIERFGGDIDRFMVLKGIS